MTIALAIKAFFDSISKTMNVYETKIKNQTTTEVVKDKKMLKQASNITEEILEIVDRYVETFEPSDIKRYNKLKKKFLRVN